MPQQQATTHVNDEKYKVTNLLDNTLVMLFYLRLLAIEVYDARKVFAIHFLLKQTRNRVQAQIGQPVVYHILQALLQNSVIHREITVHLVQVHN